ncbi:hypothetical protein [Novosphingobium aerophilum]|uniref:Uncharacterized protein n=1 Tax=Novosphingobium aerophilum TaxID=2839843 RepID=A0A7X1F5L5_9SPHN|nr:hypothetical protein [Novosphingobium aerophilum]MBC2650768.1 hypothetical protein [Novosphingobium aerophilum]
MRTLALLCSTLLLAAPQIAAAQTGPSCLTAREFTALSTYALPSVISGTSRACATVLPSTAFLRRSGGDLAQRYSATRAPVWPEAKAAFLKMTAARDPGAAQLFSSMPDDALQQIADAAVSGIVTGQIKPETCGTIDRVLSLVSPLPAESTAELIAIASGLASRAGGARLGNVPLCKA